MTETEPDFSRLIHQLSYPEPASGAALQALVEAGEASIPHLAGELHQEDAAARARVVRALAQIGGEAAVDPLIIAVADLDIPVRREAVEGLTAIGEPSISRLCALMETEAAADLIPVSQVLVRIGKPALPQLLPVFSRARHWRREVMVQVLGEIADPAAVAPLCRALESSYPSGNLARRIAWVLVRIAEQNPTPELRNALPILRRFLPPWYFGSPRELQEFHTAIREIETRTRAVRQMPVPAQPPHASRGGLPVPAALNISEPETLPIPTKEGPAPSPCSTSPGGLVRFWRTLRRK